MTKLSDEELNLAVELAQGVLRHVTWAEWEMDKIASALLAAVAELERIGPVYEAAVKLVDRRWLPSYQETHDLIAAIDSARSKADKP